MGDGPEMYLDSEDNEVGDLQDRADEMAEMVRDGIMEGNTVVILCPHGMFVNIQPGNDQIHEVFSFMIEGLYKWFTGLNKMPTGIITIDKESLN